MQQGQITYCGPAPLPGELWTAWNGDPWLIAALVLTALAGWRVPSRAAWLAGVAVLAVAFISPLCALASALFSARVLHHVLIVAIAAPLLARGAGWQARAGGAAFLAHLSAVWLWHLPQPYAAALASVPVYWLMEITLLASALWLWSTMLHAARAGQAVALALGTLLQMGMLGALLTFARRPLYEAHFATTQPFGLTALADQQLAGLMMWVPAALPYLGLALWRLTGHLLPAGERA